MRKEHFGVLLLFAAAGCAASAQEVSQSGLELKAPRAMVSQPERARSAMVASVHELATEAGIEVLRRGGNAVDAAVAVAAALAVVHPEAGNLGGGGYMLVRMADGRAKVIDYRETAPAAAGPGLYKSEAEARVGFKASAVPGTPAGLGAAHEMFGRKSWREVFEPARKLAYDGFPASQRMELILKLQVPVMKQFAEARKLFLHGAEQPLVQGELLRQPELAETIERLQKKGWQEFYTGETARRIAADMAANQGTITAADLAGYKAVVSDPISTTYRGYPVLTAPPSSGGGFVLLEMLNILENFENGLGKEGSTRSRHLMIEAMRRAYRDRRLYAGDPGFVKIPLERLISKEYAKELAASIRLDKATANDRLPAVSTSGGAEGEGFEGGFESGDTTHFTVIDADGNIVSNTYTLNGFYGSQVIAKGTGVLLNNIMSAFTGRTGPNQIAARRRPVSSMAPVILLTPEQKPWMAFGSPGALTISNTVFQVVVNLIDYKMSLRDAIEYPRIHHGYTPDRVDAEPGALVEDVAERLTGMGHVLNKKYRSQGDVHAVGIEEGGWRIGWSDGRRGGFAKGY